VGLIYLVAGEASGDALGCRLMGALRALQPEVAFAGVGGVQMAERGLVSLFPMRELAVMGFLEVAPRILRLRRRLAETVADISAKRPAIVVTIDSPGFALRLLREVARLGIRRVHYVAPQVWAWRESRVRRYPGLWDDLLCLLPFEPAFFARHGLPARFVGHPVLESGADRGDAERFRDRHAIPAGEPAVTVMPGSRRTEAGRLLPVLGAALRLVAKQRAVVPVVPVAAPAAEAVQAGTAGWAVRPILVTEAQEKYDAFAASAAAVTKSGTSTLELAMAGVPMLVTYRVHPISAALARRMIQVPYASLLNLLSGGEVVPELLQEACTPQRVAEVLCRLLDGSSEQRAAFGPVLEMLRPPGGLMPSEAAAEAVLERVDQS
jgi:lipid-A-disaccharide synthase